jgi:Domain of unknown function (DUF4381)
MPRATAIFLTCFFAFLSAAMPLHAQDPAEEDIRGPKELIEIPVLEKPPYVLWVGISGGILFVGLAALWWKKRRRRQRSKSPSETALASLATLTSAGDRMAAETFAYQAALTVRSYIADRFGIAAPRRTTEEFLRDLAADGSPLASQGDSLRNFLKSCDLAKFAGSTLDENQRHGLIEAARGFIRSTSPAP